LNTLLYEYVAMDDTDVETITFFNSAAVTNSNDPATNKSSKPNSAKSQAPLNLNHMVRV
jgi:hypothetical protein